MLQEMVFGNFPHPPKKKKLNKGRLFTWINVLTRRGNTIKLVKLQTRGGIMLILKRNEI